MKMAPWPTVLEHSFDFRGLSTRGRLLRGVGRIIPAQTLPAIVTVLRVMAGEVICKGYLSDAKGYLLDAKTQIVDTVRFISFTIGSSDLSHKLGQPVVELRS